MTYVSGIAVTIAIKNISIIVIAYNYIPLVISGICIMTQDIVGLIPAAGNARRLGPLPCSKEILPTGFIEQPGKYPELQVATGLDHSLMAFADADILSVHIVISPEKSDIPKYTNKRDLHANMNLHFSTVRNSPNILVSLDTPFLEHQEKNVALLFPDIIFEPRNLLLPLLETFNQNHPDVVLALFPTDRGDKMDIVTLSADGQIETIQPKPGSGISGMTWIAAVWNPRFSALLHDEARNSITRNQNEREIYIGDVVNHAIQKGLSVIGVPFKNSWCIDLGTTADLRNYWRTRL